MPSLYFTKVENKDYPALTYQAANNAIEINNTKVVHLVISLLKQYKGLFLTSYYMDCIDKPQGSHVVETTDYTFINRSYLSLWEDSLTSLVNPTLESLIESTRPE